MDELIEAGEDTLLPVYCDGLESVGREEGRESSIQVVRERDALVHLPPEQGSCWSSESAEW